MSRSRILIATGTGAGPRRLTAAGTVASTGVAVSHCHGPPHRCRSGFRSLPPAALMSRRVSPAQAHSSRQRCHAGLRMLSIAGADVAPGLAGSLRGGLISRRVSQTHRRRHRCHTGSRLLTAAGASVTVSQANRRGRQHRCHAGRGLALRRTVAGTGATQGLAGSLTVAAGAGVTVSRDHRCRHRRVSESRRASFAHCRRRRARAMADPGPRRLS